MTSTLKDIEKLESDLWGAVDHLRAIFRLTSSDYFMPVSDVIFLRHAANPPGNGSDWRGAGVWGSGV